MTMLKPSDSSQIFKKLLTTKIKNISKLKMKTDLCLEYCKLFDIAPEKAKTGQFEYKRFNFDRGCNIPENRAKRILEIYINHINQVEAEINEAIFSEDEIQNTPGLVRLRVEKGDPLYDKSLGKIHLEFDVFYLNITDTLPPIQDMHMHTVISWFNLRKLPHSVIWMILICVVIIFINGKIIINESYSQEMHTVILEQYAERLEEQLTTLYRTFQVNNNQYDQLINSKEKKLAELTYDLSNTRNIIDSYNEQLLFLEDRHSYLDSIKDQIEPELYQKARDAFMQGNTSIAYELYEEFKQKNEVTIQNAAKANYEQGRIDEDRLEYQHAYELYTRAMQLHPEKSEYNDKAGFLAHTLGHFNKAIEYYEKALVSDLKNHGEDHPEVARDWHNLGKTWIELAKYDKAIAYVEKALMSDLKTYGEDHSSVARERHTLGVAWWYLGQYDKAIKYHEKALSSDLKTYGENHPSVARDRNDLGLTWGFKGQYDKTIRYFEKALASNLKTYGEDHPIVAERWNNLGMVWKFLGQYDKAIEYLEIALASNLKTYGEDHPEVAIRWNNLGSAWESKDQYNKAIKYYEKALASDIKTFGEDHPKVAIRWNNLGLAWNAKGQYDKAIRYFEKAVASDIKTFGEDHPQVAIRWNNLGMAWESKGQYDKAIEYYEKALVSDLKTYGEDHPDVAIRWNNLGMAWKAKGQYNKAIEYLEKALASDLKTYGEDHPDMAIIWNNLGEVWYSKGQYHKAIKYFENTLPVFKVKLGEDHRRTKKCLNNLNLAKAAAVVKVD